MAVFENYISCPLVMDGEVYMCNISIRGSVKPNFDSANLNTEETLKALGGTILELFKDIRFNGKISQNYIGIRQDAR